MNPWITKTDAIAALKAGAVLRTARVGSQMWRSLTTTDGHSFRVRQPTFDAVLAALGKNLRATTVGVGSSERRYVGGTA